MHISNQVAAELIRQGCTFNGAEYRKLCVTGGVFGFSAAIIRMDDAGRWLERVDGFGNVERDVDMRNFADNAKGAIAAVLA